MSRHFFLFFFVLCAVVFTSCDDKEEPKSLYELLKEEVITTLNKKTELSEFTAALQEIDFGAIQSEELTLFAVKNSGMNQSTTKAMNDESMNIRRQIVKGKYSKSSLTDSLMLTALDGSGLLIRNTGGKIYINGVELGEEVQAGKTVAYVVDKAIPASEPIAPVLTTAEVTAITATGAIASGNITNAGTPAYTVRGFYYATVANPADSTKTTVAGTGTGIFTATLSGLQPGTKYYIRAYAVNSNGIVYGNEVIFTTAAAPALPPVFGPISVTDTSVTTSSARINAEITNAGTPAYTERGFCFATAANPTVDNTKITIAGTTTGAFLTRLTGLAAGTEYYVRAYAINSGGTTYSNEVSFTTQSISGDDINENSALLLESIYHNRVLYHTFQYDAQGRLTKFVDNWSEKVFKYNTAGDVTEINGTAVTKNSNTITMGGDKFTLNNKGLLEKYEDYMGHSTTYAYDAGGNLLDVYDLDGNETFSNYDSKKSPFYSCASPQWLLMYYFKTYGVNNNPGKNIHESFGEETWSYECNVAGYPVKRTSSRDGEYTFTYKKK